MNTPPGVLGPVSVSRSLSSGDNIGGDGTEAGPYPAKRLRVLGSLYRLLHNGVSFPRGAYCLPVMLAKPERVLLGQRHQGGFVLVTGPFWQVVVHVHYLVCVEDMTTWAKRGGNVWR